MTFDWYVEQRQHKKVKLCDVYLCRNVTCNDIVRSLHGIGLHEWERYMSHVFSDAVLKAFSHQEKMADITKMFSCNLVGIDDSGQHTKKQKDVCEFLKEKLFNIVSETEDELRVSIKWSVLKH